MIGMIYSKLEVPVLKELELMQTEDVVMGINMWKRGGRDLVGVCNIGLQIIGLYDKYLVNLRMYYIFNYSPTYQ